MAITGSVRLHERFSDDPACDSWIREVIWHDVSPWVSAYVGPYHLMTPRQIIDVAFDHFGPLAAKDLGFTLH
jgi:hypothetical protein